MTRGVSIHIGLNSVDPTGYEGWDGQLAGCENDARSMQQIAQGCGYESTMLLTKDATSQAVCQAIGAAAQELASGDYLLLTYSGHGGQVPDANGDEDDGQDETWVLYDRMVCDDELYALWSQFTAGVKIFVLSDSCHSGTVTRAVLTSRSPDTAQSPKELFYRQLGELAKNTRAVGLPQPTTRFKRIPGGIQARAWQKREALYNTLQWVSGHPKDRPINATVVLISGCQDNQLSMDGDANGLFTEKLLQTWANGGFQGGHYCFYEGIKNLMPPTQTPNYFVTGAADSAFEEARPFELPTADVSSGAGSGSEASSGPTSTTTTSDTSAALPSTTPAPVAGTPSVSGPASTSPYNPPSFTVDLAGNPYYVFEMADDESAFNSPPSENSAHYYGSWADADQPGRMVNPTFTIPDLAWSVMAAASSTLHYRICTTTSERNDQWENYKTSEAKSITVESDKGKRSAPPTAMRSVRPRATTKAGNGSRRDLI